ncbi:MAG: tRNA (5-methylaminomethyl-2-thiouridine)(34)-methyltransferase MnmD [Bacteroidota bacterium]
MEPTPYTHNLIREPELIVTRDGSHSLWRPDLKESYHSIHGAIQESKHIFIHQGLLSWLKHEAKSNVNILEIGFGTGLNALLTYMASLTTTVQISYTGLDPYPIPDKYVQSLNYAAQLAQQPNSRATYKDLQIAFERLHMVGTTRLCKIVDHFSFKRINDTFQAFSAPPNTFDIVYFDAFSPNKQPIMWSRDIFKKAHQMMRLRGIIVTYCAQGTFKRYLKQLGMHVKTLPGPPGKKEMTSAQKCEAY